MASRRTAAAQIQTLFPGHDRLIDVAYRDDPTFRELCDDYRRCAAAIERWRGLNGDESMSRVDEYSELLDRLAHEVEAWLEESGDDSPRMPAVEP